MSDRDLCLNMNWSKNGPADCLKAFAEDRGLFYMTGIGTAMEYRYMDSDFGIIRFRNMTSAGQLLHHAFQIQLCRNRYPEDLHSAG